MNKNIVKPKTFSPAELRFSYFELQTYWGVRKPHFGGFKATQELVELSQVSRDKYVLDVGCGLGITACYIAKKYGCRVVGIDTSEEMINKAKEKAKKKGVKDRVEFRVADIQALPFENNIFDIVIGESILAFLDDKQRGISECVRVVKPGGYVGFNEATWIKEPSEEFVEYILRITGAKLETSDGWKKLLENSGLRVVEIRTYKNSALRQSVDEMKYIGVIDFIKGWYRFLSLYIRSTAFRKYLKEVQPPKSVFKDFYKCLGYGLYIGVK